MKWARLFRLKLLDYLIIIAILLFGLILFKFLYPNEQWINVAVNSNNNPFFVANSLKVGDFEKTSSGKKIAEVTKVQIFRSFQTADSKIAQKDIFLNAKILVKINSRSGEFEYKNKIIKVGTPIDFSFNSGQMTGKIVTLGGQKQEGRTDVILTLKMYSEWPWFADDLKIGDGETDGTGQRVLELISKDVAPAQMTTVGSGGETHLTTDPRKVDIIIRAKIKVQKIGEDLIFKGDQRIVKGDLFSSNAGNTLIKDALIESIE